MFLDAGIVSKVWDRNNGVNVDGKSRFTSQLCITNKNEKIFFVCDTILNSIAKDFFSEVELIEFN